MEEQRYRFLRKGVLLNRRGQERPAIYWETECPDCGVTFEVPTNESFTGILRRCTDCRKTGVKVNMKPVAVWPEGGGASDAAPRPGPKPVAYGLKPAL